MFVTHIKQSTDLIIIVYGFSEIDVEIYIIIFGYKIHQFS